MTLRDFFALYSALGIGCAIAAYLRAEPPRHRALGSALVMVPLWPLWAPFAFARPSSRYVPVSSPGSGTAHERIARALADAVAAVAGTQVEALLSRRDAAQILSDVERVAARLGELEALVRADGFDLEASARRIAELERAGPAERRALAALRLRHESATRLRRLRDADARAMDELAELVDALRAQVVLARYAGSSADAAGGIVNELRERLEALGSAAGEGTAS
jgi:hypothetical protein